MQLEPNQTIIFEELKNIKISNFPIKKIIEIKNPFELLTNSILLTFTHAESPYLLHEDLLKVASLYFEFYINVGNKYYNKNTQLVSNYYIGETKSLFDPVSYFASFGIYSGKKSNFGDMILRKILYPFFNYWDNLTIYEKHELKKRLKIDKLNEFHYFFYNLCDSKAFFSDVGTKSHKIMEKKQLCDIKLRFKS